MASDNESDGNGPSRRPSAGSTAASFEDDEWKSITSNPFSGEFPAKKTNANFRSELGIFVNIEREGNGRPSTDEEGGRATLPRAPRRQSGISTTGSFDGDDWERIEDDHHSKDGNASRRGISSGVSTDWTFEMAMAETMRGDGYLADEGYYEVEVALNGSPEDTPHATDYQNRGIDPSGKSPTSASPSSPKLDIAGNPGAASVTFSKESWTSRSEWEESHRTSSRESSPHHNESLLRSYLSFPSIIQTEAPSARKKRIVPENEIEDSESDDYPAFTNRRSCTVGRSLCHRALEEYSTSAPRRYSASLRYSNVPVADLVVPSESSR